MLALSPTRRDSGKTIDLRFAASAPWRLEAVIHTHAWRNEADGVNAVVAGKEDGSPVVELLGNDDDARLTEHIIGANRGAERPERGIITEDLVARYSQGGQAVLHVFGFVASTDVVISAHQKKIDLSRPGRGLPPPRFDS